MPRSKLNTRMTKDKESKEEKGNARTRKVNILLMTKKDAKSTATLLQMENLICMPAMEKKSSGVVHASIGEITRATVMMTLSTVTKSSS